MRNMITLPFKNLFIDFDCTLVDSIDAVCRMYNKKYKDYPGFKRASGSKLQGYDFRDQCPLEPDPISYFSTSELLKYLRPFEDPKILIELAKRLPTYIITIGTQKNIHEKSMFINDTYPTVNSIYLSFNDIRIADKSIIDMSDSAFVDDNLTNLETSNAKYKFVFGKERDYNRTTKYPRIQSILDVFEEHYYVKN